MNEPVIFAIIAFGVKLDFTLVIHLFLHSVLTLVSYWLAQFKLTEKWSKILAFGLSLVVNLTNEINDGLKWQWNENNFFGIDDFTVGIVAALLACKYAQIIVDWLGRIIVRKHGLT